MRNILLSVSYDGTDFCGWQRQDTPNKNEAVRTVQGVLEDALFRLHKASTPVCGSGRTDSGVHALCQAADFASPVDSIPIGRYPRAINSFLPPDVRITAAREVPIGFSARFSATSRVYRYFIATDDTPAAILPRYTWCIHRSLNIERLNALAKELRGEVDCASFAASEGSIHAACGGALTDKGSAQAGEGTVGHSSNSTFRYIYDMRFFEQAAMAGGHIVVFEIEANAFLYHMVRNLVGTLLLLEKQGAQKGSLALIAKEKDRGKAGPTAPAQGLFLWNVKFDGVRRGGG